MENTTMEMNTELVCVMASLGYHDDTDYFLGEDCLPSLKDLIRFLKHEDESCNIRRQMGHSQLIQKDLLPMFMFHAENAELIDIVVRLLVNLTSPADICFNKNQSELAEESAPTKMSNTYSAKQMEVVGHLQGYKEAFVNEKAMSAIAAQIGKVLQMEMEDRGEDEYLLFERLLLLLRNILHVPASPEDEKRTDDDASLHDQILWSMHLNGIDDLLVYICSSPEESRWAMHSIEIVHLMLREQNPEKLAQTSEIRSESEKLEDTRELMKAKEKEQAIKKTSTKKVSNTRHSRFGGSFWVSNMKGIGHKNTLVHHQHVSDANDISFDHKKYRAKVPVRKREAKDNIVERRSTLTIRLLLKEFCKKFLEDCYNPLMRQVKENITSKRSQENDETFYMWALRFFMAFNRVHSFKVEYVSETLNMNIFYQTLKQINHYYDNFFMHKRGGWEPWQRRLHYGIQAYKELLTYIAHMDTSHDTILKDASSIIKNNVFYHEEYRSIFLVLIRHYDAHKQSKKYLADLIDTFHVFLKMLERFCSNKGAIIIKTKRKKQKARKKKRPTNRRAPPQLTNEQLDELWEDDVAPNLSSILQGNEELPSDIAPPFDPASDRPDDEQRLATMVRIQDCLRTSKHGKAVVLLRASREFWPDDAVFGSNDISREDEFMLLRSLLFQELDRPEYMNEMAAEDNEEEEAGGEDEEEDDPGEEEEVEENRVESVEREFNMKAFLSSLASPQILIPYAYLLKNFEKNTSSTNHAIIKMMHRVAVELKFPEMFFQLSIFITFKELLDVECSEYKELCKFAKYITGKFVAAASERPKIFVEALFWKGTGDCYQISEREDQMPNQSAKYREKWTFEDEEELKSLYEQYRDSDDVVGDILKSIVDKDRTRRQISNKLVRMRLVDSAKDLPRPKKAKARDWSEEQTEELHRLFEEFKETDNILNNIMVAITSGKSKQAVVAQLIATGKISDRTQLKKKKEKKRRRRRNEEFKELVDGEDGENDSGSSSDEENEEGNLENFLESQRSSNANATNSNSPANNSDDSDNDDQADITLDDSVVDDLPPNASVSDLTRKVKEIGFSQQIIWLQTRLTREAEAREEDPQDEWYATPLLTMTDEDERAMKNRLFRRLLRKIGVKPPADFNVATWWTIPPSLTPAYLRKMISQIESTVSSTSIAPRESNTQNESVTDLTPDEPSTSVSASASASASGKESQYQNTVNPTENESEISTATTTNKKKKKKSRVMIESDSEDDSEDGGLVVDELYKSPMKETKQSTNQSMDKDAENSDAEPKRRISMMDSDDDIENSDKTPLEESQVSKNADQKDVEHFNGENVISKPGTKRRSVMLNSDSEDDEKENQPKRSRVEESEKPPNIIDEDLPIKSKPSTLPPTEEVLNTMESEFDHEQSALNFSLHLSEGEDEIEEEATVGR
ncbi:protein timeless homolog [Clytia hemisphaerica]|uniref:protein timeless homolog n=1 Tax=Clytia hemisphaerica TaxID=252671 RepID=UPI0034D52932